MTTHDPAVEAAQRASARYETNGQISLQAIAAAREALRPIRELHFAHRVAVDNWTCCPHCAVTWPCATAELIYSSEELEPQ